MHHAEIRWLAIAGIGFPCLILDSSLNFLGRIQLPI